eukprot:SAG11_NODE_2738_length_3026_cov_267.680560_2_plen_69_part_00
MIIEGENPVRDLRLLSLASVCWRVGLFEITAQMGGKFHLKLNIGERPIANKYREGKMQRTLKRELKSA